MRVPVFTNDLCATSYLTQKIPCCHPVHVQSCVGVLGFHGCNPKFDSCYRRVRLSLGLLLRIEYTHSEQRVYAIHLPDECASLPQFCEPLTNLFNIKSSQSLFNSSFVRKAKSFG